MKKIGNKKFRHILQLLTASTLLLGGMTTTALAEEGDSVQKTAVNSQTLTILGTSDVHGQLWNWSYEDDKAAAVGLSQVSTVVKNVRTENPNGTILIDNGDMVQGTILTDDLYNKEPLISEPHPMIKAMNEIKYDAMVLGNHEFNFGLDLISKIKSEANFPILSANTYLKGTENRYVGGTTLKEIDLDGDKVTDVTVGIIGLTTPHIPKWDGAKVDSLDFKALQSEAEKAVAELEGSADIVVASIHAGRADSDPAASADQVINNVAGIDAYILGHDHRSFAEQIKSPSASGTTAVGAPKDTGIEMVRIDLDIEKVNGEWEVKNSTPSIIDTTKVEADKELKAATETYHNTTREFISETIGTATDSFLPKEEVAGIPEAQLQPTAMISLINNVQRKFTGAQLAASALFKADSKLEKGNISYSNVFDIYKYPNTLVSVNITGANLLTYMENQAKYYNTPEAEDLTISFNDSIRVYNYDIFSGVDYKIDISKPEGERIINPTIEGKAVDPAANYTIAMNNYRYEGLLAAGIVTEEPIVSTDPETLRGFIAQYIKEKGTLDPEKEIERNWEVIGYNFDEDWRALAVELVNNGTLKTTPSADGRTPNVKAITKQDVKDAGFQPTTVNIMHTNDIHGRLEAADGVLGMARLKTFKDLKNPALMIDVGDAFQGLPISNFSEGMDMVEIMNEVGYDAMAVGNHEFDFGLERTLAYKDSLNFPLLSNNTYKDGKLIFEPYTIIEKDGKKFAVIGVTTPETATKTHPNNVVGVTFADPIEETKKVVTALKDGDEAIDAFIIAGHLGIDATTPNEWRGDTLAEAMSKAFPDLNMVVLDGHSHTAVDGGKMYGNVLYTQTGNYLNNVGLVKIDLNDTTKKSATLTKAADLAELEENAAVKALVDAAKAKFDKWGSKVVIENNPYLFNGERENVRTRETNLGNLVGDAMMNYGQTGFSEPTDFAVTNGGGLRANIEPGAVTLGDIIAVLPFGNSISQIKVTGAQVKEMFEMSLRSFAQKDENGNIILDDYGQPKLGANGGFLHVSSSIRVYYDSTKQGTLLVKDEGNDTDKTIVGNRVLSVEIQNKETGKFEAIKDDASYNMATNDFLAAGGDGYNMLGGEREEGPSLDTVLIDHLQQAATIRVLDAATNIDLSQYEEQFPGKRIVSIAEADFNKIPGDGDGTKDSGTDDSTTGSQDKNTDKTAGGNYPKTGERIVSYLGIGLLAAGTAGAGFYLYNQRKVS
ncbi:5'-nucleotidase C-terminal domain-containing protein [Enterococcus sp. BWR-S5]|uniref:5'-nucleotidase C-terminal domain-containing protein n=1 Tax=Enterococcus sp. BWR-S5 TaxID=2787714 RepID=UPI003FA5B72E